MISRAQKTTLSWIVLIGVVSQAYTQGLSKPFASHVPTDYSLSWQDTFSTFNTHNWSRGLECDSSVAHIIWNRANGGKCLLNNAYCSYITDEDAYIENGSLVLRNQKRSYKGEFPARQFQYTCGWVNSMNKKFFNGTRKGVYVEIKAKFPSGLKVWPAIWLVTEKPHWPPEIDIWEYFGHYWDGNDKMYMRYIYPKTAKESWKKGNHADSSESIDNFDKDHDCEIWHIYGYQWTADKMVWSIDGKIVRTLKKSSILKYWPNENFCLVMNNSVATKPANKNTTWPNYLAVDYLAVYEKKTTEHGD